MMIAIMSVYLALLFGLVWLGVIRFNTFWKVSPIILLIMTPIELIGKLATRGAGRLPRGKPQPAHEDCGIEVKQSGHRASPRLESRPVHVPCSVPVDHRMHAIIAGHALARPTPKAIL